MITCVGSVFLDRVVKIDKFPEKPIKIIAKGLEKRLGGPAAIASFTINSLGGQSEFVGRFGDDDVATFLKSEFDQFNISYRKSLVIENALSSQSHIFEDSLGERLLAAFNEQKLLDEKRLPNLTFTSNQSYLVDIRWIEAARYVAKNAHENNLYCVADVDNFSRNNIVEEIVNSASHPIFSETGLFEYTKEKSKIDSLKSLYKANNKFYAVTLGSEGVYWIDKGVIYHSPAPRIDVTETNGAGDVFHGAFARFIDANKSIQESIELATAAASLKCSRSGGIRAIPKYNELIEFSKQLKPTRVIK